MDLNAFQQAALLTDNTAHHYEGEESRKDLVVALLGIAGELGTLATAYKKFLRDGPSYGLYQANVKEELGDLLWYVAVLAHKFGLDLSAIAEDNLAKTNGRWGAASTEIHYDTAYPEKEQLPRNFIISFSEIPIDGDGTKVVLKWQDLVLGDNLTDNVKNEDGYRFHDAFHLSFAAVLGWSPVLRKLMHKKRKSDKRIDEYEDGGRAIVIEEGIAAYIFEYGEAHDDLERVRAVDFDVLKTAKSMTQRLEVSSRSWHDWELAIMSGYAVFRELKRNRGGWVIGDLDARTIRYAKERPE